MIARRGYRSVSDFIVEGLVGRLGDFDVRLDDFEGDGLVDVGDAALVAILLAMVDSVTAFADDEHIVVGVLCVLLLQGLHQHPLRMEKLGFARGDGSDAGGFPLRSGHGCFDLDGK